MSKKRRSLVRIALGVLVLAGLAVAYFLGYRAGGRTISPPERQQLEEDFARSMSGVVLEGSFTIDGEDGGGAPRRVERYTIERVSKVAGDVWLFQSRLEFGDTDVSLPVPVRLLWAGDTPVVTLTDATIPGLGTFTARVLFYRDRYTGLWAGGDSGGHQFGRIVRE